MKTVIATIKPFKLDEIRDELRAIGFPGFRVFECRGFSNHMGHSETYRGAEYVIDFLPKADVVITVPDKDVDRVVKGILKVARTGRNGDGRITVNPTEQFWNIRTGENESEARSATVE